MDLTLYLNGNFKNEYQLCSIFQTWNSLVFDDTLEVVYLNSVMFTDLFRTLSDISELIMTAELSTSFFHKIGVML